MLTTLANYSNLSPKFPYAQTSFDLSSYKGQTIQVYLVGTEDQGLQTSFLIDDFSLDVATTTTTTDDFSIAATPATLTAVVRNASREALPGIAVSWQVTGVRQDRWANAHRVMVEEEKSEAERDLYLHPEVHGQPASKTVVKTYRG